MRSVAYGGGPERSGDLFLPDVAHPAVVCTLNGGQLAEPGGRRQMHDLAAWLARCGYAVWNVSYRHLDGSRRGCVATLRDVDNAMQRLSTLALDFALDPARLAVVAQGAGWMPATWWAGRGGAVGTGAGRPLRALAVAGLAPALCADAAPARRSADLADAAAQDIDDARIRGARRPLVAPAPRQLLMYGAPCEPGAISLHRRYAAARLGTSSALDVLELAGTRPMELVDPTSAAFDPLRRWLDRALRTSGDACLAQDTEAAPAPWDPALPCLAGAW